MNDRPKRILIVEDEEIILADIARIVRSQGHQVAAAVSSGPAAVEAAETVRPDLVLMDVRLQGSMDGVAAAHRIRAKSDVPILFVTAYAGAVSLNFGDLPGRYGSIAKPFSATELRQAIASIAGD